MIPNLDFRVTTSSISKMVQDRHHYNGILMGTLALLSGVNSLTVSNLANFSTARSDGASHGLSVTAKFFINTDFHMAIVDQSERGLTGVAFLPLI